MRYPHSFLKIRRLRDVISVFVLNSLLLATVPLHAQDQKPNKSDDQDVVKVTSNLVSLDVIVKDKKGRPITDLKAEDFTVTENGVPQKITFFDSTLTTTTEVTQSTGAAGPAETKPRTTPGGFPRNIIALVLDGQSTELPNLKHVREGMLKYIRERISENDSVALFSISGGLQLLQSFTHDKGALIAAVEKAYDSSTVSKTSEARSISESISALRDKVAAGPPGDTVASSPAAGAAGSAMAEKMIAQRMLEEYIQFRSVLSAQQTRPVLAALAAIAEGLRSIPGKKTLVMFSQGFVAPESLDWQVQSTVDIANRANVAIYIIDSTGLTGGTPTSGSLVAASPLAGISGALDMEQRRRAAAGESVFDISRQEGLNRQQDLLYRISEDTGGHFLKNTNDIGAGLERIDSEIRSRYTLAYRSTDPNFDGSFRKVKIEVRRQEGLNRQQDLLYRISEDTGGHFLKNTNDIGAGLERIDSEIRSRYTLAYRSTDPNFDGSFRKVKIEVRRPDTNVLTRAGYYAIPPSQIVPMSPDDRKLLANFAGMAANPTLPLSVQLTSFRSREGLYVVPLAFEVPPAAIQFDPKGDKHRLQLDVLGVVRAEGEDKILTRLGGSFDVALSPAQYESISHDKIFYRQDVLLGTGSYTVDLIVRDRLSGKSAAKREKLELPLDDSSFASTEAVLSRHAEPVKPNTRAADVFTEGNVQIRPSPSREFRSTDNLIVFFQLYNAAVSRDTGTPLVRVTLTLMRDGKQVARPIDYQLTETVNDPMPHLTFAKYIKLGGLSSGKYSALIESRDLVQQKVVKQDVSFEIVP